MKRAPAAAKKVDTTPVLFDQPEEEAPLPSSQQLMDTYAPVQQPGAGESFVRGAAQGASLGFADEITGALRSAFSTKSYQQARDESRAAYKAAEEANPMAYFAGNVTGGLASIFVPGGGIAKAATVGGRNAAGAAMGGEAMGH